MIAPADFITNFPQFTAVPTAVVQYWINQAYSQLAAWPLGNQLDYAASLFTAHSLVLWQRAQAEAAGGGQPGTGVGMVSSKAVGGASISYDNGATTSSTAGAGIYNATPMAPIRIRLSAQATSRLNQLFEMNLNPSHSCTAKATSPPLTIIAVAWTIETAIAVPRFPRMSAAAAWWSASCFPALQIPEIDGQQHQARAMCRRDGEGPERQLCRLDTGQETGMAAGDQQVDARRYDQQPGCSADFMLPSDEGRHSGERRQDACHRQKVPGAERTKRRDQVPSSLAHQPGGNRQWPAHSGVDAVIDAAGDYGQPKGGLHPLSSL